MADLHPTIETHPVGTKFLARLYGEGAVFFCEVMSWNLDAPQIVFSAGRNEVDAETYAEDPQKVFLLNQAGDGNQDLIISQSDLRLRLANFVFPTISDFPVGTPVLYFHGPDSVVIETVIDQWKSNLVVGISLAVGEEQQTVYFDVKRILVSRVPSV